MYGLCRPTPHHPALGANIMSADTIRTCQDNRLSPAGIVRFLRTLSQFQACPACRRLLSFRPPRLIGPSGSCSAVRVLPRRRTHKLKITCPSKNISPASGRRGRPTPLRPPSQRSTIGHSQRTRRMRELNPRRTAPDSLSRRAQQTDICLPSKFQIRCETTVFGTAAIAVLPVFHGSYGVRTHRLSVDNRMSSPSRPTIQKVSYG